MATPAEIIAEAQCVACSGSATMFETLAITMLKRITGMTQAEVNAESGCWTCYGVSQSEAAILVLLNAIAERGGAANMRGSGSPQGVVTPNAALVFYTDIDAYGPGQHAQWQALDATDSNWVNWI